MLGGCGSLSFLTPAPEEEVPGPAGAASAPINSERAEYRIDVRAPDELRGMLLTDLDLARFQDAPATEGINAAELEWLARAAPAQARGLLETEGYFNADAEVTREAGPNGAAAAARERGPGAAHACRIVPGRREVRCRRRCGRPHRRSSSCARSGR